jgi:hypothetical protein
MSGTGSPIPSTGQAVSCTPIRPSDSAAATLIRPGEPTRCAAAEMKPRRACLSLSASPAVIMVMFGKLCSRVIFLPSNCGTTSASASRSAAPSRKGANSNFESVGKSASCCKRTTRCSIFSSAKLRCRTVFGEDLSCGGARIIRRYPRAANSGPDRLWPKLDSQCCRIISRASEGLNVNLFTTCTCFTRGSHQCDVHKTTLIYAILLRRASAIAG